MLTELEPRLIHAPELSGSAWMNSQPIFLRELEGRVILLDFWDYTCINCLRTLPYIQAWDALYRDSGLVTIGVHTPEFEFAMSEHLVGMALKNLGVDYPVVLDNTGSIWSAYANRYWPTRMLIDRQGYIRYSQHGERGYQEFERAIQVLLRELGFHGVLPPLMNPIREEDEPGAVCNRPTSEIHAGYLRGALGNVEGYNPEFDAPFADPGIYLPGRFYLNGTWWSGRESVRFVGGVGNDGVFVLPYEAKDVNAVLRSSTGKPVRVRVEQDGARVLSTAFGEDLRTDKKQRSVLVVDEPRMYRIIRNAEFGSHILRLSPEAEGLEVYALSFTTSVVNSGFSAN